MKRDVPLEKRVLSENDRLAGRLADQFAEAGVRVLNLMSSPGAGKTSLLEATAQALGGEMRLAAVEGDLATDHDARRLTDAGIPTQLVNTGGGCHLSAAQIAEAAGRIDLAQVDLLVIENVGNLVCPAGFDLGEHDRIVVASTPEGEDKPAKYPVAFRRADLVVLNKIDLADAAGFTVEAFRGYVAGLRDDLQVLEVSCRTGDGLDAWFDWLRRCLAASKKNPHRER